MADSLIELIEKQIAAAKNILRVARLYRHANSARNIGNVHEAEAFEAKADQLAGKLDGKEGE